MSTCAVDEDGGRDAGAVSAASTPIATESEKGKKNILDTIYHRSTEEAFEILHD